MEIMIDQEELENVEYFNYFGSMKSNYARWTRKIKDFFTSKFDFNLRKKLVKRTNTF